MVRRTKKYITYKRADPPQNPPDPAATKAVFNEQTKLLATGLNTAATSSFTVGIATPIAGYIYNVSNLQNTLPLWVLGAGVSGWLITAVSLHLIARRVLRKILP